MSLEVAGSAIKMVQKGWNLEKRKGWKAEGRRQRHEHVILVSLVMIGIVGYIVLEPLIKLCCCVDNSYRATDEPTSSKELFNRR